MAKQTRTDRVRDIVLRAGPDGTDVISVTAELGEERKVVEYTLIDLAKRGELLRTAPGRYRTATDEERRNVEAARARAFQRAEREEQGPPPRRDPAPAATPPEIPKLTPIGRRKDGSIVCEDSHGELWVATKLTGGKR